MWKSRIFWKIYVINLLIVCILLGAMFVTARMTLPELSRQRYQSITATVAANLSEQVTNVYQYMMETEYAVQSNRHLRSGDANELDHDLEEIALNPLIDSVSVTDSQGYVLTSFPQNSGYRQGEFMGYTGYFQKAVQQHWTYISDVL
ncbi:MAG: PDC sensor domain-containing protein, partial [Tumebacillaceae bacterium]